MRLSRGVELSLVAKLKTITGHTIKQVKEAIRIVKLATLFGWYLQAVAPHTSDGALARNRPQ
jgi:hypothetical protein